MLKIKYYFFILSLFLVTNPYAGSLQNNKINEIHSVPIKIRYQKKVVKGEPCIVVFETLKNQDTLDVYVNSKKIEYFNIAENKYFFFLNYDILSKLNKDQFRIQMYNKEIGYELVKRYKIYDKDVFRERIFLPKQYYEKDEKLVKKIKYLLSSYEYAKLEQTYNKTYNKFYEGEFIIPVKGRITSSFGNIRSYNGGSFNSYHKGIDIADRKINTPVKATNHGLVILRECFYGRGKTLILAHGHSIKSLYFHLNGFEVQEGDIVKKGDTIGYIGSTGFSTGPHLHWEMRVGDNPVDPNYFLETNLEKIFRINFEN